MAVYRFFAAKVDYEKRVRNLKNKDLANMTGYSVNVIVNFMNGRTESEEVAKALSKALNIPL